MKLHLTMKFIAFWLIRNRPAVNRQSVAPVSSRGSASTPADYTMQPDRDLLGTAEKEQHLVFPWKRPAVAAAWVAAVAVAIEIQITRHFKLI